MKSRGCTQQSPDLKPALVGSESLYQSVVAVTLAFSKWEPLLEVLIYLRLTGVFG